MPEVADLDSVRLASCLETLLNLSLSAGTVLDPEEHARQAIGHMVRLMGAERGMIFVSQAGEMKLAAAHGVPAEEYAVSSTVVKQVVETQEPVLSVDAPADPRLQRLSSVTTSAVRSILAAPLLARGKLIGVLYLDNRIRAGVFDDKDVAVACAVGNHIAHALETARAARLEARLHGERRQRQLADALRETSLSITATLDQEQVVSRLLQGLSELVHYDRTATYFPDWQNEPPAPEIQHIMDSGRPLLQGNALSVPLLSGRQPIGVVCIFRDAAPFDEHEVHLAYTLISQAGIALENARLFRRVSEMATTDQLTGVWNRSHWLSLAEHAVRHSARNAEPLSALVLDVDHFKHFNDRHGHLVGDQVLRAVAQRCRATLRDSDLFGRFGGEEFVAVLPATAREGAEQSAERIGQAVRSTPVAEGLQVTVSIGLAEWRAGEAVEEVLRRADAALYQAKAGGRDCFRVAD